MRIWARAVVDTVCGACRARIAIGEAVELVELAKMTRKLVRCERCAETPKPLVLPDQSRTTKPMQPIRTLALHLPRDFKQAEGGE